MAHPFQQRKLLITVCKAEIGWDQPESLTLQSGYVTLVAGPFRASTRSVPATRRTRPGSGGASTAQSLGPSSAQGLQLSWAPSLGPELFVLTEDCLLVADLVVGAELWGPKTGGRWNNSDTLYAQSEICLDAEGRALLLSGRCLEVRLPLMQPQGQVGGGKGKGGGAGGGGGTGGGRITAAGGGTAAAPPPPVLGVLALSMLLQPADAEAAVARHLPPELVPRLLLDTTRLLPGAVVRGAAGVAYVEPCVVFLRVRLISATGLGRGGKEGLQSHSSTPGHSHHHHHHLPHLQHGEAGRGGFPGLSGHFQELGAKLQAHMDRTMGHVGAFISRLKDQHGKNQAPGASAAAATAAAAPPPPSAAAGQRTPAVALEPSAPEPLSEAAAAPPRMGPGSTRRKSMEEVYSHQINMGGNGIGVSAGGGGLLGCVGGNGRETGVDDAAAEAVMSLLETNGFAVVDNRRLSNYFWCKISYEGQYHTSRLVPVAAGAVRWDETFVMAALRPARNAQLDIELYGSNDSKSRGKVVCQLSVPLCDLMDQVLRNHHHRVSELENQRQQQEQQDEEQEFLADVQRRRHQHHRTRSISTLPGIRTLQSALKSAAATVAAVTGGAGGGASGAAAGSNSRVPPYHPDSWTRGRAVLTARIGGPGGHASATHGSPMGPDGGARECTFQLEVEAVDADTRAAANDTQLLPWATLQQHCSQQSVHRLQGRTPAAPAAAAAAAVEGDNGEATAGWATPHSVGVTSSRHGFTGSAVVVGADGGNSGGDIAGLSPPWSPVSRTGGGGGGGGGGSDDVSVSPTGVGTAGVMSLGSIVAACFVHEAASTSAILTAAASSSVVAPPPGEEDLWMPPHDLPHIRSHVAEGAPANVGWPADDELTAVDSPTANSISGTVTAPETGVPCTPNVHTEPLRRFGGRAATADAATAVEAMVATAPAAPPPPGLCPAVALAASACATLSLVCHDLELERPPPPEAAIGGSGVAVGGQAAQHAAAVAAITQCDYFVAVRCGAVWLTTNSLRVVGAGGGGGAAAAGGSNGGARLTPHLGVVAPLLKPSTLVSLALFRRTDVVAGKKVLNVRAMIGMMASEQLVGKLRLRASSLVPGRPVTICLPLKAERSSPRPCATVAWCRMTLLLSLGPMGLARLIAAYSEPPTYPPIAMLQAGAVPGQGPSETLPLLDPSKHVEPEALKRRERRLIIKWVSESSPGLSVNASRKLVEDGRTEFNAGRTTQNWRRIGRALSATEPLKRFWDRVQSWSSPPLTLAVAAGEVALLIWPSRTFTLLLLVLVLWMLANRNAMMRSLESEQGLTDHDHHDGMAAAAAVVADAADDATAAVGNGGSGSSNGGDGDTGSRRAQAGAAASIANGTRSYFGEPPLMVEDIGNEPDVAAAAAPGMGGRPGDADTAADAAGPIGIGGFAFVAASSSVQPPTPMAAASGLAAASSNPIPIPPSPSAAASVTATAASWIFGASPPTAGAGGVGGEWAAQRGGLTGGTTGGGSAEVPKDPLGALRQQYEHMLYFGLRVQNVLDDIAGGMERLQALLSWHDPVASGCFVVSMALTAVLLWTVGMRVLLGAVLLYDLRPPRWRDPWLPPPANVFAHLPTRADLMM